MQRIKSSFEEDLAVAERNIHFFLQQNIQTRGNKKLIKILEFIADYGLLFMYLINRLFKLRSGRISGIDYEFLYDFCEKNNISRILEFGPGASTRAFLKLKEIEICSYEFNPKWLKFAQQEFASYPNLTISKFDDQDEIEIDAEGSFDLCFIDSPVGKPSLSRLNTCLCASKYSNLIILHDSKRKGERETIQYMQTLGWKTHFINTSKGLCILRKS